jgi:hypothetical protein
MPGLILTGSKTHQRASYKLAFDSSGITRMASDDERQSWLKEFELYGLETLRLRIANPWVTMTDEYRREAEAWVRREDTKAEVREEARYRTIRRWTIIAAAAGVVAAITGIVTVFR